MGAGTAALSLVALMIVISPTSAEAGFFNFLLSPFKAQAASSEGASHTALHTMALPRAAMNIDPNPAKGGGDITIVEDSALLSEEGPAGTIADITGNTSHEITTYTVREGDNISTIAAMFGVSVNTVRWSNDLSRTATIQPGQKLVILPVTGLKYEVEKGDTLASIAKEYNGDLTEIAIFNDLDPDASLTVGMDIIIPNGEIAAPAPTARTTSVATRSSSALPSISGYYMRPISGGTKTTGIHGYNAVDLADALGTPIMASAAGEVIVVRNSGWNGGYGNYVVIRHNNGTQTLYAHTNENAVYEGQYVSQGQVIAYIGSTGRSTGPHVHFEIRGAKNPF